MKKVIIIFVAVLVVVCAIILFLIQPSPDEGINLAKMNQSEKIAWFKSTSNEEKKEVLTEQQYRVLVDKKMEAAFAGDLTYNKKEGMYYSVICDYPVFDSTHKFEDKSGWLNFDMANLSNVQFREEYRTEKIQVLSICGEYLGYVEDSDASTSGKQFIINSESLRFEKK